MRVLRLRALVTAASVAAALAPAGVLAQAKREPPAACVASCTEACQKELVSSGCNPAIGLTACRIRQDQCVAHCTRKCPHA